MKTFIDKFTLLKKYPDMYLVNNELNVAISFVAGMDMMLESSIGDSFAEWVKSKKLEERLSFGWPVLVQMFMKKAKVDSEKQTQAFFELMLEFLTEQHTEQGEP